MSIIKYIILNLFTFSLFIISSPTYAQDNQNKYCIDEVCIFDPISNFQTASFRRKFYKDDLNKAINKFPICNNDYITTEITSKSGYLMNIAFKAVAAPQGEHYVVTEIKAGIKGVYTDAQIKEIFLRLVDKAKYGKVFENKKFQYSLSATSYYNDAEITLSAYNFIMLFTEIKDGIFITYNTRLSSKYTENLKMQPGCKSKTPVL